MVCINAPVIGSYRFQVALPAAVAGSAKPGAEPLKLHKVLMIGAVPLVPATPPQPCAKRRF